MRVVEQFVEGKDPDQRRCEDVIAITDTHVAIFDGSGGTGLGPKDTTGARFAATELARALSQLPADSTFTEAATFLSSRLDERIRDTLGDVARSERPAAVAVIYSEPNREIWRVGDPHLAIDGDIRPGSLSTGRAFSGFRSLNLNLLLLSEDATVSSLIAEDPTREDLENLVPRWHLLRNRDSETGWEFGAFDGTPIPARFLEVLPVPAGASRVVLTSDGYPAPSPTLEEAEATITDLLARDPLCIGTFQAEKGLRKGMLSFDDRAYVRLSV
ncbi:MAG: hypothetical protein QOE25_321 [Actinomycetota bacterium]|nr:hypothetical protein [Actinomycetota bacterium]